MNPANNAQVTGPLAAFLPLATAALVSYGMDDHTAGLIAGGVVMLIAGGFSWWRGRPVQMAQELVDRGAVTVQTSPSSPDELKAAAADPTVKGIEPAKPPTFRT
jgi:phage-related minor tail protein